MGQMLIVWLIAYDRKPKGRQQGIRSLQSGAFLVGYGKEAKGRERIVRARAAGEDTGPAGVGGAGGFGEALGCRRKPSAGFVRARDVLYLDNGATVADPQVHMVPLNDEKSQ